jgi:hypothetical protein
VCPTYSTPFSTALRLSARLPRTDTSPRPSHGILVNPHHLSFSRSRLAHDHPAIQRDRQPARVFLVVHSSPESSEAEHLDSPPGGTWQWVPQALQVHNRGAAVVGRISADSPSLLRTFGRAPWARGSQRLLRSSGMSQFHPVDHVLRPAIAPAIPRSHPPGRCGARL